ncbi:PRC-barrel domain-containing protein [Chamaesiphon sp. GL140_3_metabinner_50]|uniref:PRC-barrel domain-containing protein n=1 Tax=Chamaesiphon sp. GL140_3_metabinner_50 TaxID=2970812 RepID=UPI0025F2F80F|nr:PRC-barrel domain-containing protein [Chamaesiphon sp. GL140_3_metabinner_50]
MRKGKDIIGKPIITYDSGQKVANIVDLIFNQNDNRLLGLLISESGWFSSAKVLPLYLVKAIGVDAIIIPSRDTIASSRSYADIHQILENNNILNGTRIMTTDGRNLGKLIDLYFDETSGAIEGYETSGGLFADAYSGRSFVPATQAIKIGKDVAFVPVETIALMEEQVGGLKAAFQTASEKVQSTAQVAGEKFQETAQIAGERFQETAQVAGEKFQSTTQIAGEKLQTAGRLASSKVTDAIVDRDAQKQFVIGKVAQQTVTGNDGTIFVRSGETIAPEMANAAERSGILDRLYRATGGNLTAPLGERMNNTVAGLTIEQAQGRRAQRAVYTPEGYIIAAQGQIITPGAIERAKATRQESALLTAVGLSAPAAQTQASSLATTTGERLKTTTSVAGDRLQEGAANVWDRVRETANDLQGRSSQALEQKRIKGALGRPTTRVILDRHDEVILNVGELISHKAIDRARSAGILDVLLDSVYTETPRLSLDELRAPEKGSAAL